jgi:hypothetical protein
VKLATDPNTAEWVMIAQSGLIKLSAATITKEKFIEFINL